MEIFNKIGSKERLFEMFENVNRIKLNEDISTDDNTLILNVVFDDLKSGLLKINKSETQTVNELSYVVLTCTDNKNNISRFTFRVNTNEGDQDNTFNVDDVDITGFSFRSSDNVNSFVMDEDDLREFNQQHKNEFFNIIDKYIDVETEEIGKEMDELYEDAIKKIDSYPFGGGSERMQTGLAYADEKPTNPKVRVNAPELKKIVEDTEISDITSRYFESLTPEKKERLIDNAKSIVFNSLNNDFSKISHVELVNMVKEKANELYEKELTNLNEVNYDDPTGVGFDTSDVSSKYFKSLDPDNKKMYIDAALKDIVSELGINIINQKPKDFVNLVAKKANELYEKDLIATNENIDYPEQMGREFKAVTKYPKPKRKHSTKKIKIKENLDNVDDSDIDISDIQYTGDGVGKDTPIEDIDKKQLVVGIAVEYEHTSDRNLSASIAIDHLTEHSDYYTKLLESGLVDEEEAIDLGIKYLNFEPIEDSEENLETNQEQSEDNDELTDKLLGYKSMNVGDDIDEGLGKAIGTAALAGALSFGAPNFNNVKASDINQNKTELTQQETKQQSYDRMSQVQNNDENDKGFGAGNANDQTTSLKKAISNAKQNIKNKQHMENIGVTYKILEKKVFDDGKNNYDTYVIIQMD